MRISEAYGVHTWSKLLLRHHGPISCISESCRYIQKPYPSDDISYWIHLGYSKSTKKRNTPIPAVSNPSPPFFNLWWDLVTILITLLVLLFIKSILLQSERGCMCVYPPAYGPAKAIGPMCDSADMRLCGEWVCVCVCVCACVCTANWYNHREYFIHWDS